MSGKKQNKNEIEKQTIQLKETWLNPGPLLDVNNNWMKSSITLTPERYVWYIMYYNVWDNRGINLLLNEKCEFWWPTSEGRMDKLILMLIKHHSANMNLASLPAY